MSPGTPPAAVEEESADKVTVVLAAAAGSVSKLQAAPVGVGYVPVAAEDETATAVAVRGSAGVPAWVLGSWIGPVIQGQPGSLAAVGPDWEDPAAGRRETGQTVGLKLANKVAETVGALGKSLAVAPGTVGACGAADRVVLPGCVEQKLEEGAVALGKVSGCRVVQAGSGSTAFAADLDEGPGLAGRNREPGPENYSLLVPADRKIQSVDHTACHPCLRGCVLAFPLGIFGDLVGHNPGQGNQVLVADLSEVLAVSADRMDRLLHMADPSFCPFDPWDQAAGF